MTPRYGFEPSDSTQHKHMNLPYYQTLGKPQGFGALPDAPVPNPYYHLQGQQPLPPLDPLSLDDAYPIPTSLHRLQTQQLSHFSTGPSLHQFPPTPHDSAHLTSPNSAFLPTPASAFQQQPPALSNHRPSISTSIAPIAAATTSPAKSSPTAPSKSAAANSPSNSNAAGPPKKKYPCPHATAFNCSDTFTTSGHAARHGKKHTGEKNVQCPTCGKAFTRKDNMKQHERTHKGANAHSTAPTTTQSSHSRVPSGSASPASVVKTPVSASRSRRTSDVLRAQSSTPGASVASPTDDAMDLDVTTSSGAGRQSMMAPMVPQMGGGGGGGSKNERPRMPRSELSEILENVQNSGVADGVGEADAEGESPGLDALALAAGQA
ncbi:uncharacterized protein KY384_002013 [Bacidia gigantensis]|uniref:uncharacterized protein n=1 Tax=Bacidia gigantensis TaxID=2732470 RepID=UPI001D03DCF0|nr:uncharacterized protein KY384_002013 [Bacidia gigantensis]KAG8533230.1 hypothetical protein KY384_002013 [Bacidia gigantensis]